MRIQTRSHRQGVSLVEIAIVIAIFGIMSAIAVQSMAGMVPSWRTKRASREFLVNVQKARDLAISEGVEYRVRVDAWDSDPGNGDASIGAYYLERGNAATSSTTWDILPMDEDAVVNDDEGHIVFTRDTDNQLPWVSLLEPVQTTTIVFNSRGFLENPSTDFDSAGMINFVFFNKRALVVDGQNEWWQVSVSRAGFARLAGTYTTAIGAGAGTSGTTNYGTSSGSGYTGG